MTRTLSSYLRFLWAGLAKRGQTGDLMPSQRFLIARMIAPVPVAYRGQLIELGAGNGAITLCLAARCPAAHILACEINPVLAQDNRDHLAAAGLNRQVEVVCDSAEHLLLDMEKNGLPKADFILSGIPLAPLDRAKTGRLIEIISRRVADDGMYIQFRHSLVDRKNIQACFPNVRTVGALLNFPPAVVYYARK
jgi:phospholipid N-methyltransferase